VKFRMLDEPVTQTLSAVIAAPEDIGTGALAGGDEFTHAVSARELPSSKIDARVISTA
jgi:hypothetical protein